MESITYMHHQSQQHGYRIFSFHFSHYQVIAYLITFFLRETIKIASAKCVVGPSPVFFSGEICNKYAFLHLSCRTQAAKMHLMDIVYNYIKICTVSNIAIVWEPWSKLSTGITVTTYYIHTSNIYSKSFIPLITKPTRITSESATLIDKVFHNCMDSQLSYGALQSDISNHFGFLCICHITLKSK